MVRPPLGSSLESLENIQNTGYFLGYRVSVSSPLLALGSKSGSFKVATIVRRIEPTVKYKTVHHTPIIRKFNKCFEECKLSKLTSVAGVDTVDWVKLGVDGVL